MNPLRMQAVEEQAFVFDRDSVRFRVCPRTKEASVYMEGEWAGDDGRYLVKMTPSSSASRRVSRSNIPHQSGLTCPALWTITAVKTCDTSCSPLAFAWCCTRARGGCAPHQLRGTHGRQTHT